MAGDAVKKIEGSKQSELFSAETTWFHVFKAMIDNGDAGKMGGNAFLVYAVIKSYTNFSTGRAFPAIETIMEKSHLSKSQVLREIKTLEEHGYITKAKQGRGNVYTLREKVDIQDETGRPVAAASWDYLPGGVRDAVADLKNVMMTGDFAGAKIVQIQNLTVNVFQDHATQVNINVDQLLTDMDKLPPEIADKLRAKLTKSPE